MCPPGLAPVHRLRSSFVEGVRHCAFDNGPERVKPANERLYLTTRSVLSGLTPGSTTRRHEFELTNGTTSATGSVIEARVAESPVLATAVCES